MLWVFYDGVCGPSCSISNSEVNIFLLIARVFLTIGAILNSTRIILVYILNDNDLLSERLFYIGVGVLAFSYFLYSIFLEEFLILSRAEINSSIAVISVIFFFFLSLIILILDKQTWDKSIGFIKWRVGFGVFNFTILLVDPILGLGSSFVITILAALLYAKVPEFENTD